MNHPTTVARIKTQLKKNGITLRAVATEAGVGPSCVSHVLSGRLKSANVVLAAQRLLTSAAERKSA